MSELDLTEAVAAAAIARWDAVRAGIPDDTTWDMRQPHARRFDTDSMRAALTAAAPLIAGQATADLRARIEALRDATRLTEVIRRVTDTWDEPLDEVHDIPQIVNALIADALIGGA